MARALTAALVVAVLAVPGGGGSGTQSPRVGGTVVFGPGREPPCLNVFVEACTTPGYLIPYFIADEVLPGAFGVGPDATFRKRLVDSVTVTKTPPFTLTYHIRSEARWSDGVPVSARDFVFTHRALVKLKVSFEELKQVAGVRELDAKTVRVVLRSRYAGWRRLFGTVLPQHAFAGEDIAKIWSGRIDNPKTGRPIGSGPFLVESWERGKQLTLVRNPGYWGPHAAYLERLVLRFCREVCASPPPSEALSALRRREVDITMTRDTDIIPDLRRIPGATVLTTPSNGWEHLEIRLGPGGHPALQSKLVRRALAYGIDRVALVRQIHREVDPKYPVSDSAIFPSYSRYYRPNWVAYRYRPAQARRLLEQAGCRTGADGIYVCAGDRLSLHLLSTAGNAFRERAATLIQAQLRPIGVEVIPSFVALQQLYGQIYPSGKWDLTLFAWFRDPDPSVMKEVIGCAGPANISGYCQRLVNSAFKEADHILETDAQARVLNGVDATLASDVPLIPLYQGPYVFAFRKGIRNVVVGPFNPISTAENWWLER